MFPTKEAYLPKSALRSVRFTAPILMALGAMNAWTAQTKTDYAALSTALCLCVCAAGLFGEDLVQRGHRQDLMVLAHVAAHPGAEIRGIARAVGAPERVVTRNLSRLTEDRLVAVVEDDVDPALRSYRLAS
ncbi:MarR family transcriptional regulator [Streptomyces viridochromogenes]|nr:helix-turn-helix domain-containing protein [Streptomyces viridochromogenes]